MNAAKQDDDPDRSLKRLGGGRWQTRDERFSIEPQSGTWSLVDAEQTDELGLPLVRGPFRSLTDAKAAITQARASGQAPSPLAGRTAKPSGDKPTKAPAKQDSKSGGSGARKSPSKAEPPPEPSWISDLEPADRRRAHRLIDKLEASGVRDPEGIVRKDLAGRVPTIVRVAIADRLAGTLDAKDGKLLAKLLDILVEGRDETLDVRWRLIDDDGRPIGLTAADIDAAREREKRHEKS